MPFNGIQTFRKSPLYPAFSLIELVVVIATISILAAIAIPAFSDKYNNARRVSREIIKSHLQQARAHAITTRTLTALVIPVESSEKLGLRAISSIEVKLEKENYVVRENDNEHHALLKHWSELPQNFHFISKDLIPSEHLTAVDFEKTISVKERDQVTQCHIIVFTPNGQIAYPPSGVPIHLAIAPVMKTGENFQMISKSNNKSVFDLLQINRLTAKARSISPQ